MTSLRKNPSGAPAIRAGLAGSMLRSVLSSRLLTGSLVITTPAGVRVANPGLAPGPAAELVLHRWRALRRLLFGGDLGFSEAYLDGDWDSPDIAAFIELAALNLDATERYSEGTLISRLQRKWLHAARPNTRRGARRNVEAHYDLGNAFYGTWLDAGMNYSSALYEADKRSLEDAQRAKQDRLLHLLDVRRGQRILEIGCGWGSLAARLAVETGADVTGITISPAQFEVAQARVGGKNARIKLQDYRDLTGTFDRIVCVEMLEAVGAAHWQEFFARLHARLAPGGRAVLQVITIAENRFATYLRRPDFIQRHIFPGGMLPTVDIMRREIARAGFALEGVERFGESYARTLAEWHHRFEARWESLKDQGFDEAFRRKWKYYLQYCEGGFRAGATDVGFYTIVNPAA